MARADYPGLTPEERKALAAAETIDERAVVFLAALGERRISCQDGHAAAALITLTKTTDDGSGGVLD